MEETRKGKPGREQTGWGRCARQAAWEGEREGSRRDLKKLCARGTPTSRQPIVELAFLHRFHPRTALDTLQSASCWHSLLAAQFPGSIRLLIAAHCSSTLTSDLHGQRTNTQSQCPRPRPRLSPSRSSPLSAMTLHSLQWLPRGPQVTAPVRSARPTTSCRITGIGS